jgi:ribonuclease Z
MTRRRRMLLALVIAVLALGAAAMAALHNPSVVAYYFERQARARFAEFAARGDLFNDSALHVVLCGTGSPLPDANRAKSCVMVIAGGRAYVVDTGPQSWNALALMLFPADRIAGVFLTHFHSDHIGDLGEFRLQTWVAGRRQLLPVYGGPGVEKVVDGFNLAYALDDRYRAAHHGPAVTPIEAAPLIARPFATGMSDTHDKSEVVLDDNGLKVTAFEVYHEPVRPAVGYRFDYKGRSVVVSGDTTKWRNVAANAKGADVLVHEAQTQRMRQILADTAQAAGNKSVAKIFADIESYHSSPVDAAEIANEASVKLLVFTHFIPPLVSSILNPLFFDHVSDVRPQAGWLVGFDGLRLDLPVGSDAIVQTKMPLGLLR